MGNLLENIRKKICEKLSITTREEVDIKEKQTLKQNTLEELKQAKYLLGEIYIGGISKNDTNKRIENLWDVMDNVERYVLLRRLPNSEWFMDIETGEYYKQAEIVVDYNTFCKIRYSVNSFKHKTYYITETMNLMSLINEEEHAYNSIVDVDKIKAIFRSEVKYNFLKNNEKLNQLFLREGKSYERHM